MTPEQWMTAALGNVDRSIALIEAIDEQLDNPFTTSDDRVRLLAARDQRAAGAEDLFRRVEQASATPSRRFLRAARGLPVGSAALDAAVREFREEVAHA